MRSVDISLNLPNNANAHSYIKWSLDGNFYRPERYIATKIINDRVSVPEVSSDFFRLFKNWIEIEAAVDLKYAIGELIDNVFDHANSKIGLCLSAQKYKDRIELCIADLGIGIAQSFQIHQKWEQKTPLEWFKFGLQMKGTSKPMEHTGEGLSSILEWLTNNEGCKGILYSQNHFWKLKDGSSTVREISHVVWPGTLIWFSIPIQMNINLRMIWDKFGLGRDELDDLFR